METKVRSVVKTISWRIVATLTTIWLVFIFTGNIAISTSVGALEVFSKILIYYIHERVWNLTDFGRERSDD